MTMSFDRALLALTWLSFKGELHGMAYMDLGLCTVQSGV